MTVTLITGTSTGIGQSCALHFARKGHHVFASMRNPDAGGAPLREAAAEEGLKLDVVCIDVDDEASVSVGVSDVLAQAGPVDVLINNAGVGGAGNVETTPDDVWRSTMETNFFGTVRMCRAVLPGMRKRGSGAIVNVSSVSGRYAVPPQGPYTASKFAVEGFSEVLAIETRRFGIRIAIIQPGVILTPIFEKNMKTPDMESPYVEFDVRMGRFFLKRLEDPAPPELVAEVIDRALTDDPPKLRYPVGWDAEAILESRAATTDEEHVDVGLPMTDEEFAIFSKERLGTDL